MVSVVVYAGAALLGEIPWPPPPQRGALDIGLVIWMVAMAVIAGLIFWNYGVQKLGIVISSIYLNFVPIFAVLIIAILGTPPRLLQIAGGALVLIGVFLSQRHHFAWYRRIARAASGGGSP